MWWLTFCTTLSTGDFCPYIQTGENSGQYRHPHLALVALELWIANQCMPEKCAATWLDSPNGKDYAADSTKTTSITWAEMDDNDDPMSQPAVPYAWPNSGNGIYPGYDVLYPGDLESKDVDGVMTLPDAEYVKSDEPVEDTTGEPPVETTLPSDSADEVTDSVDAPVDSTSNGSAPESSASFASMSIASAILTMIGIVAA